MNEDIHFKAKEIQKLLNLSSNELILAVEDMSRDPKNSLTKSRIVLEIIVPRIYKMQFDKDPLRSNGSDMSLGDILNSEEFKKYIDERMHIRMMFVKNLGNMGPHPKEEDTFIDSKDAFDAVSAICDIAIWYLEKYENKASLKKRIDEQITARHQYMQEQSNKDIDSIISEDISDEDVEEILSENEVLRSLASEDSKDMQPIYEFRKINAEFEPIQREEKEVLAQIRIAKVPHEEIDKASRVYVVPNYYEEANKVLIDNNLLILINSKRSGKYTTAIHLLKQMDIIKIEKIYTDELKVKFSYLNNIKFEEKCGYIIENFDFPNDYSYIDNLSSKLKKVGSFLVITTADILNKISVAKSFTVDLDFAVNKYEMLLSHIWYASNTEDEFNCIKGIISGTDFENFAENNITEPHEVNVIVKKIMKAFREGSLEEEDITLYFPFRVEEQIKEWFEEHKNIEEVCMFTMLALFNNCRYSVVKDMADSFKRYIIEYHNLKQSNESDFRSIVSTRMEMVETVHSHIYLKTKNREYGTEVEEFIAFKNGEYQNSVLGYIQNELERIYEPLLSWMYEYCVFKDIELMKKISSAVLLMCRNDFSTIKDRLLQKWAVSNSYWAGMTVALILNNLTHDIKYLNKVWKLVYHWSSLSNNDRLSWISVLVYGDGLGLNYPKKSLNNLYRLAASRNKKLYKSIRIAFQKLFRYGSYDDNYYKYVLHILLYWIQNAKSREEKNEALNIFLDLCTNLSNSGSMELKYYVMTVLMEDKVYLETYITKIFVQCLNVPSCYKRAKDVLSRWFRNIEFNSSHEKSFIKFIVLIYQDSETNTQVKIYNFLKHISEDNIVGSNLANKTLTLFN